MMLCCKVVVEYESDAGAVRGFDSVAVAGDVVIWPFVCTLVVECREKDCVIWSQEKPDHPSCEI
jgi:hypothetical protein